MTAHEDFLLGLAAMQKAVDELAVRAPNDVGKFLRRGLTVSGFNLLEAFIIGRIEELAAYANKGSTQFLDLPIKLQRRAITQTVSVAKARMSFGNPQSADLRDLSRSLGRSLQAVDHALHISPFTWLWTGSNMSADDYMTTLRLFHVSPLAQHIRDLLRRLNLLPSLPSGATYDPKEDLHELAQERHRCAHDASSNVTSLWLRAAPERLLRHAICFEAFASIAIHQIHVADADFLSDEKWIESSKISIRFIRQRKKDVAEYREGKDIAKRVRKDGDISALMAAACAEKVPFELIVQQDETLRVVDWAIPTVV
ncbi:hypothetical protein [Quadrisphaera sp. INWT6]|uniref:hypothetical protein n=1 Tax=Quadrisphaera sp. INWT6 TaxID=2596917 RepID=UPI0018926DAC|nr:hypothetical protein [Quadrisphaera sp. INWT6]MBF5082573.1 hypothetical protein [Quadrisphaera sp. INWT6]